MGHLYYFAPCILPQLANKYHSIVFYLFLEVRYIFLILCVDILQVGLSDMTYCNSIRGMEKRNSKYYVSKLTQN